VKGHPCDAERGCHVGSGGNAMQGWKGILCKLQRCHAGREMKAMQGWDVCNEVKKRIQCRDAEGCHAVR